MPLDFFQCQLPDEIQRLVFVPEPPASPALVQQMPVVLSAVRFDWVPALVTALMRRGEQVVHVREEGVNSSFKLCVWLHGNERERDIYSPREEGTRPRTCCYPAVGWYLQECKHSGIRGCKGAKDGKLKFQLHVWDKGCKEGYIQGPLLHSHNSLLHYISRALYQKHSRWTFKQLQAPEHHTLLSLSSWSELSAGHAIMNQVLWAFFFFLIGWECTAWFCNCRWVCTVGRGREEWIWRGFSTCVLESVSFSRRVESAQQLEQSTALKYLCQTRRSPLPTPFKARFYCGQDIVSGSGWSVWWLIMGTGKKMR